MPGKTRKTKKLAKKLRPGDVIAREAVHCERCGHTWLPRLDEPPSRCARCKRRNYVYRVGVLRPGRQARPLPER